MRYFVYARKSTDSEDRQVMSIEAQLTELREFAVREKLEIAASFTEAKTAKEPGRTVFGEMLSRIEAGEADGILAWHADRLARNSIDGGRIIYSLDTGKIKDLKFPTLWFENTPQGKFMLSIAFGQSKYYVDNLSENIKRGHRQKLRKGIRPNIAPLGYLNNPKTRGIDVDTEKAGAVRKAFEMYARGENTLKQVEQFFADAQISYKGKHLSVSSVQRILRNPFYYGVFYFSGEMYEGSYEPIISKKLFDSVQQVMANRGKKQRKRKHAFAFSGLMTCGACGCRITAEKQKGHNYYRCTKKKQTCEEKYIREEELAEQMTKVIQKVSLPEEDVKQMTAWIDGEKAEAQEKTQTLVQNLSTDKKVVEAKMEKLLDLLIEGRGIDPDEYQHKKQKLLNEKLEIQQKVKDFEREGNNWLEPMRQMLFLVSQAKILLSQNSPAEISTFLKNIGSNFILKGKKFSFSAKIGWRALINSAPNTALRRGWDLNPRSLAGHRFSRAAPSTTQTPLQMRKGWDLASTKIFFRKFCLATASRFVSPASSPNIAPAFESTTRAKLLARSSLTSFAEGVGFEPTVHFHGQQFSRLSLSTAQPPFQIFF